MKKIFFTFVFLIFSSICFANQNLNKLNNLYLNGILDQETYFKSLKNLGINTENDIFLNLFDLFSEQVLNQQSYEKSILNLIDLSTNNASSKNAGSQSEKINSLNDEITKIYSYGKCLGEADICLFFKSAENLKLSLVDNVIKWPQVFKELLIKDPSFSRVNEEKFKLFNDNKKFNAILSMFHMRGLIIDFIIDGEFTEDNFFAKNIFIRSQGKDFASVILIEN